ncbi:MAG TPA: EF-hand domain-containing protein [Rhodocyclaceae bacterium]|nr:EF-hand domain-containing protein [Rhodocyclaceae bacterium]
MKANARFATLLFVAAAPLAALAAQPAAAPAGDPAARTTTAAMDPPAPLFQQLDVNHDGSITTEEAKRSAEVTARFKELDANHDGKISVAEFNKGMQAKP